MTSKQILQQECSFINHGYLFHLPVFFLTSLRNWVTKNAPRNLWTFWPSVRSGKNSSVRLAKYTPDKPTKESLLLSLRTPWPFPKASSLCSTRTMS